MSEATEHMRGVDKAAAFLLTLPEELVKKIFSMLDEIEIREISIAMANLGRIDAKVTEQIYEDVRDQVGGAGALVGTFESTEKLLSAVLSKDRADMIMEEIRGPAGRTMWDKLSNVNEELLANYLKNEYPQTIAVIMSKIKTEHASKVLGFLPDSLSMEVVLRMLRMEPVHKEIIADIEKTLRQEFMNNLARSNRRDPHELIADIFNYFDRSTESKFMSSLEERNPESCERVKSLMFTFDDMIRLDNAGIQAVIRVVDKGKLALALKGANDNIKDLFFKNMSERAAKIMKEDMVGLGMVRVKDVDEAQSVMVMTAKDLSNSGDIMITSGKDEGDELIG